ncbi:Protein LIPL-1 [Aphelenchoides avenae]|nr:Protein LIPL-1 [Aphelenchus avenae]
MAGVSLNAVLLVSIIALTASASIPPEANLTTPEIIRYWGYPVEEHSVVTTDGYILTLHRIPHGKNEKPGTNVSKEIIFLQHGFECASSNWVANLPPQSAGFLYADAGYDVWMGNIRGNTYSRLSVNSDPDEHAFWQFSFDEMVQYDLDALIGTALNVTGKDSLYYVGHSQGSLIMFAKLAEDPTFHTKIKKFFALGPVGQVQNMEGLMAFLAKFFYYGARLLFEILGQGEFLPNNWFMKLVAQTFCGSSTAPLCDNLVFLLFGPESNQFNVSRTSVYLSHMPAGTSTQNVLHWAQMAKSGKVQKYDYWSKKENIEHYGQSTPPIYDFGKDNVPIYLYWSDTDWIADKKDVQNYLLKVIKPEYLKQSVELTDFNHMDFVWGLRAAREIYAPIQQIIDADVRKSLKSA